MLKMSYFAERCARALVGITAWELARKAVRWFWNPPKQNYNNKSKR